MSEKKTWRAFLALVDNLSTISQSYTLQVSNWKNWSLSEWENFAYLVNEYLQLPNEYWKNHLPEHWNENYIYLWIKYLNNNLPGEQKTILRLELQSDLELYNS